MFKFSDEQIARLLHGIFTGQITDQDLPENLYYAIAEYLKSGLYDGFGGSLTDFKLGSADRELLEELRENVYMFSAAKTYQEVRDMTDALTDDDGVIRSFHDFKEAAGQVFDQYNVNWLRAEYNTAIAQAQNAVKWNDIQQNKDVLPILKYNAVTDGNTCEICEPLDGITLPVDDPFWDEYYPENHFNCRCVVEQLEEGEEKLTTKSDLEDILPVVRENMTEEFLMNAGKDKVLFSDEHPYFQNAPKSAGKDNFGLPIPEEDK